MSMERIWSRINEAYLEDSGRFWAAWENLDKPLSSLGDNELKAFLEGLKGLEIKYESI